MTKIFAAGVTLLILVAIALSIGNATHVTHRTCHVTDKDRTSGSARGQSDMRIYTSDCGVMHVGDSLLSWTFHSSDTYGSIHAGHTYRLTARGWRIPFLSLFPNVVGAEETH